ncbi:MAG: class I SAM-dependent methyltransferase [bacterium]
MKNKKKLLGKVSDMWNEAADIWAEHVGKGYDIYRDEFNNPNFLKFIGSIKNKKVLDAGCGEGRNTRLFARMGATITAVDLSEKMIEFARKEEQKNPLGIDYHIGSMTDLSFLEQKSFDVVISTMALMDCPDYENSIKEFYKVLKSGGELFFNICHPCFMTKGYGWIEESENEKTKYKLLVSDYFEKESWLNKWKFSHNPEKEKQEEFEIPFFSRTISEYINILIENGFVIKKLCEPKPDKELAEKYSGLKKWQEAAPFLYIHAVKL